MICLSGIANAETKIVKINPSKSTIEWTGKKVLGQHNGTVNISEGFLQVTNNVISGGSFIIDMTSIKDIDLKDEGYNQKLIGHLKSADFFNAEKFPTATVELKKIEKYKTIGNYKITADVTIKGITNPVVFDADLNQTGNTYSGTANIVIDRSKWDVRYGSSSFFDNLGDKTISNDIQLTVKIETN
ncbi:MAG: yceI [Bacteroidota bacterium]|nr:yceI [Bacteroidota bacterium]